MKKVIFLSLIILNLSAENVPNIKNVPSACIDLLTRTRIDLSIKSYNGWRRTIKKHTVQNYTNFCILKNEMEIVENCILLTIIKPKKIRYMGNRRIK